MKRTSFLHILLLALVLSLAGGAGQRGTAQERQAAQERVEPLPFGDMERWAVRYIKESVLLGGQTKEIYVLAPTDTLRENKAFDFSQTIWGISNAYANVVGVAKGAYSTLPERREDGRGGHWCARLEARMETVRVLGLVDIKVAIAGALFLGEVFEPVRSANDPYGSVSYGIPFTKRPKALLFDVKAKVSEEQTLTKALGMGSSQVEGHDEPQIYLYLQKRWEDKNGRIFAKRVGTGFVRFSKSIPNWQNDYRVEIQYGDLSQHPDLNDYNAIPSATRDEYRSKNSQGKLKPVNEIGWADPDETPTHIMLLFSAGCHSAFYAHLGNALWIDNVRLVY